MAGLVANSESVVELLATLISIPSVNPMGRDAEGDIYFEGRVSDWLESFFGSISADYERIEVSPGRDNVIARFDNKSSTTILLDVHQDTVPVDGMTIPPFTPEIRDGRMFGRGACDVKGGMASMLHAFRRLFRERPENAANVIMSCTCDEEATTTGIDDLVQYWDTASGKSKLLDKKPSFAIVAEPTLLDVVVAHRGVTRFKIHTSGRACHSSDPTQGINAIYRMAKVVSVLEEYAEYLAESVKPHPLCGGATLSVGQIYGGTSVNIVPDGCIVEIDRRVIPGEDRSAVIADMQTFLADRVDFDFQFAPPWIESPALTDVGNERLAAAMLDSIHSIDGPHAAIGVPFGTHASRTCGAGVPSVVFGPGSIDQAHTKDEFVELNQLEKAAEVYFRVCSQAAALQ